MNLLRARQVVSHFSQWLDDGDRNGQVRLLRTTPKRPPSKTNLSHSSESKPNRIYIYIDVATNKVTTRQAKVDEELGAVVCTNGADIDPGVLYDC